MERDLIVAATNVVEQLKAVAICARVCPAFHSATIRFRSLPSDENTIHAPYTAVSAAAFQVAEPAAPPFVHT